MGAITLTEVSDRRWSSAESAIPFGMLEIAIIINMGISSFQNIL